MHGGVSEPALDLRGVSVAYGQTRAVDGVSLRLEPGELVALVGPNGAGKSSLMHAALGLVPYDGEIVVHSERACGVAFIPQRRDIDVGFPITVDQLVMQGRRPFLRFGRRPRPIDRQAAAWAIETVGLDGLGARPISDLSGGQLQRALFARALAQEAAVLLLDEPFSGVDPPTAKALTALLATMTSAGCAVLISTHDLPAVRAGFQRCLMLNRRLIADGPPREVLSGRGLETFFGVAA